MRSPSSLLTTTWITDATTVLDGDCTASTAPLTLVGIRFRGCKPESLRWLDDWSLVDRPTLSENRWGECGLPKERDLSPEEGRSEPSFDDGPLLKYRWTPCGPPVAGETLRLLNECSIDSLTPNSSAMGCRHCLRGRGWIMIDVCEVWN